VGVEPTTRPAKERVTGFEGREDHRTLFASGTDYRLRLEFAQIAAEKAYRLRDSVFPEFADPGKSKLPQTS
jgi:hypothetical protein